MESIEKLLEIMKRLRDPQTGCPWDLEQDFSTIAPYTIEEAYEVVEAIEDGDDEELTGELGDLRGQIIAGGDGSDVTLSAGSALILSGQETETVPVLPTYTLANIR